VHENSGWPITCASSQPSRVRKASLGPAIWLRLPLATRSSLRTRCSTSGPFETLSAVASSDASTCWPRPVVRRA